MVCKLLVTTLLLGPAISQTQKNQAPVTPQTAPNASLPALPPIKMGLWEATTTMSTGTNLKTRACLTQESYREQLANMPHGCTLSNSQSSSTSMSGDVTCNLQNDVKSSGHFSAQFPDPATVHMTMTVTTTMQGRSMTMTMTSDSHFVSSDCGDVSPGQSQIIQ
jgi:hypothetical protein